MNQNLTLDGNENSIVRDDQTLDQYSFNRLIQEKLAQRSSLPDGLSDKEEEINPNEVTLKKSHSNPVNAKKDLQTIENIQQLSHFGFEDPKNLIHKYIICEKGSKLESLREIISLKNPKKAQYLRELNNVISAVILSVSKGYLAFSITPNTIFINDSKQFVINLLADNNESLKLYMAPEEEQGIDKCDKSFVWSIGCIIFFIVTNEDPIIDWKSQKEKVFVKNLKPAVNNKLIYKLLKKIFRLKRSKRIGLNEIFKELKAIL